MIRIEDIYRAPIGTAPERKFGDNNAVIYWVAPSAQSPNVQQVIIAMKKLYPGLAFKMAADGKPERDPNGRYLLEDFKPTPAPGKSITAGADFVANYGFQLTPCF